ncbi:MAG: glycosyltransferase family 4 protein [Candidatus Altiarchaeota archaeon]
MRIALVCEYFPESPGREMRGGVEARTYFLGRSLAKRHDVTVYSISEEGFSPESDLEGMRVVRVAPKVRYSQASSLAERFMFMRNAAKVIGGKGFDVVDGCSVVGYPAAWWSGCKARVVTYHDVWAGRWIRNLGMKGVFGEALERYTLSRGWSHYIAVSNYTKDNLVRYGIKADRITVAANGIDVDEYSKVRSPKFENPTVCVIARLVSYKRVGDLIKAAAVVREDIPELNVKVIGTGPERSNLEALVSSLGLGGCVDFMGYVERHADVLRTLKASHAFCLPSVVEGFGISVIEAMALGVPYVASDIPAVREATRGGRGGLLYAPMNVAELASKLKVALEGGVKGGVDFIGEYDWSNSAKIVEGVYEKASKSTTTA